MNSGSRLTIFLLMAVIFGISIIVRMPNINRPLGNHHEWLTSVVLRHQQIWHEEGALKYYFNPIMTYANQADKNIINQASNHLDNQGNHYYTSYPPFAYILPYLFFKLIGIYPDVLPIQLFNLFFHFICAFFIYRIIIQITNKEDPDTLSGPAILGFAIYLFAPVTLWFHSNVYMADMMVQSFFITGIYSFLKLISAKEGKIVNYLWFGFINFLMVYTEWLGLFFAFTVFIYTVFYLKDKEKNLLPAITVFTTILALALTIWQYAQINGLDAFVASSIEKYLIRSGVSNADMGLSIITPKTWTNIIEHYIVGYLPVLIMLVLFIFYYFRIVKQTPSTQCTLLKPAVILSGVPVLLHHLAFVNFTGVHDFSVLKTGVIISILIGYFYHKIALVSQKKLPLAINCFIIILIFGSITQYWLINKNTNNLWQDLGRKIALESTGEEVVFIKSRNFFLRPELIFYARRNIAIWEDRQRAESLIRRNGVQKGVIFSLNEANTDIAQVEHFHIFDQEK